MRKKITIHHQTVSSQNAITDLTIMNMFYCDEKCCKISSDSTCSDDISRRIEKFIDCIKNTDLATKFDVATSNIVYGKHDELNGKSLIEHLQKYAPCFDGLQIVQKAILNITGCMLMIAKAKITDLDGLPKAIQIKLIQELPRPKENKATLSESNAKKRLGFFLNKLQTHL
jgi:hypothetical protein